MSLARVIKISTKFNILSLVLLGVLTGFVGCAGCESGTNFSELDLDANQVIDYGRQVTEGKAPKEAVIYGQLLVGDSSGPTSKSFEGEQKELLQDVAKLRALPKTTGVNFGAQEAPFITFVDDLNNKITAIAPQIASASQNSKAAKDLASVLEPDLKTAGKLEALLQTGEANVPAGAKAGFDALKTEVTDSFGRLYKSAVVLAQSLMQKEANAHVAKIRAALNTLENNAATKIVFSSATDLSDATIALQEVSNKLDAVGNFIDRFTSKTKVSNGFISSVGALNTAIAQINTDYVGKAEAAVKPEATSLYDDAKQAGDALTKLANDYAGGAGIEQLKSNTTDAALDALAKAAFSQPVGAPGGDLRVENPTDTNNLMSMLASTSVVGMPSDSLSQFMVYSLASAVVSNVQERFGLQVSNVLGLNPSALIQAKHAYGMDDNQFKKFVTSRADLLRKQGIEAGRNDVYVFFANDLVADGAETMAVIDAFSAGGGKVLVVSSDLSGVREKGQVFFPKNLSIAEAIATASAALENDPGISAGVAGKIADKIGRMTVAMGTPLKLNAVGSLAKDAALRVKGQATPTDKALELAVKGALITQGLPTLGLDSAGVLTADLTVLQKNVDRDPQYYAKIGAGQPDVGLLMKEQEERRKDREEAKRAAAAVKDASAKTAIRDKLNATYGQYKNSLEGIRKSIDLFNVVREYKVNIEKAHDEGARTLAAMDRLLNDPSPCLFKSQKQDDPTKPYDNGWLNFVTKPATSPAQALYLPQEIENPMSLFDITPNDVRVTAGLSRDQKAAISVNCYLHGPGTVAEGHARRFDSKVLLEVLSTKIKAYMKTIANQAKQGSEDMVSMDSAKILAAINTVSSYLTPANAMAWDKKFSPNPAIAPDFKVIEDLMGFPNVSADPTRTLNPDSPIILPNLVGIGTHLIAVRKGILPPAFDEPNPGTSNFSFRGPNPPGSWTIMRVYGSLVLPAQIVPGIGAAPDTLPAKPLGYIPATNQEFEKLNSRIWAWFASRFTDKITNTIPANAGANGLYARQKGINWFSDEHVFIKRVTSQTKNLLSQANRSLISEHALAILEKYKAMVDLLQSLPLDDYNSFINQVPPSDFSKFFKRIETVLLDSSLSKNIQNQPKAGVGNWYNSFMHNEILTRLTGGPNTFAGVIPGGTDALLGPIWTSLAGLATDIETIRVELKQRVDSL